MTYSKYNTSTCKAMSLAFNWNPKICPSFLVVIWVYTEIEAFVMVYLIEIKIEKQCRNDTVVVEKHALLFYEINSCFFWLLFCFKDCKHAATQ